MSSGNGIMKSGGIQVRLWSKKSGGLGDRGGMAQFKTSTCRTMTEVFVAIIYQHEWIRKFFRHFGKNGTYSEARIVIRVGDIDGKTY